MGSTYESLMPTRWRKQLQRYISFSPKSSGRMMGAIPHVEAMKQQLHVDIFVTRLADGSGSTLVVHP